MGKVIPIHEFYRRKQAQEQEAEARNHEDLDRYFEGVIQSNEQIRERLHEHRKQHNAGLVDYLGLHNKKKKKGK